MNALVEAVGWFGAGLLLLAYGLLSTGRLAAGRAYQALNLAGSVALAINAIAHRALPSAAVNIVWLVIGVAALRALARKRSRPQRPA